MALHSQTDSVLLAPQRRARVGSVDKLRLVASPIPASESLKVEGSWK